MKRILAFTGLMLLAITGCVSIDDVSKLPPETGATKTFTTTQTAAVGAARLALAATGFDIKSESNDGDVKVLMALDYYDGRQYPDIIRMRIGPGVKPNQIAIRIVSKKTVQTSDNLQNWPDELFTRIGEKLGEYP